MSLDGWKIVMRHEFNYPLWKSIAFIGLQFLFFSIMAWCLWSVNIFSKIESWKWKLLASVAITFLFSGISLLIEPFSDHINNFIELNKGYQKHHDDWVDWNLKIIIVFFICYISSIVYTLIRQNSEIEHNYERLQNEALQSKLAALTNQINPHFFFNSLNSLYSLVFNDHKVKSLEYITKMSGVFRYILQSEDKQLVSLKEEMDFLDTYLFMLVIKYDQKLQIDKHTNENESSFSLPTLSLLPLIENVIKHNEISNQYPMTIHIYTDEKDRLVVSNPKQERLDVTPSGLGLKNLNNRFQLIVGEEIVIEDTDELFTVRLPLLKTP